MQLIFVVGIKTQIQQQAHHIDIVILDSDLQKTVSLTIIGLKAFGMSFCIRANKIKIPKRDSRFKRLFASGLKENTRTNQTPLVEWLVATANIVNSTVQGRLALGREMGDIRTALEQFPNELVTPIRCGSVNHTPAIAMAGVEQIGLPIENRQRIPIAPLLNSLKERVIIFRNRNILTSREFAFLVFLSQNLNNLIHAAFICYGKRVRGIAVGINTRRVICTCLHEHAHGIRVLIHNRVVNSEVFVVFRHVNIDQIGLHIQNMLNFGYIALACSIAQIGDLIRSICIHVNSFLYTLLQSQIYGKRPAC